MKSFYRITLLITVIIAGLYVCVLNILGGIMGLALPYLRGFYGENIVLVGAWGLATGRGFYSASMLESVPVITTQYPPFFYLLVAVGIKIWGISYIPGRLLAMLAMFGCVGATSAIAIRRGSGKTEALLAGLLFLGTAPVYLWSGMMRVDFLAVFFELVALYFLLDERNEDLETMASFPIKRCASFVFFAVLAGYTKQTDCGLVVGALIGMFLSGDKNVKKRAVVFGTGYATFALIVFLLMEAATSGRFHKFVIGNFSLQTVWIDFVSRLVAVVSDPLSLILIVFGFFGAKREARPLRVIPIIVVPLIIAIRFIGIQGGAFNYFIESFVACAIWSALLLTSERKQADEKKKTGGILVLLVVSFSILTGAVLYRNNIKYLLEHAKYFRLNYGPAPVVTLMKEQLAPGSLVLTDYSDLPLFANCVPAMSDPYTETLMVRDGKWDPKPVLDAVKSKTIKLVLMREKITTQKPMMSLPESVANAVEENYKPATQYGMMWLYVPK